MKLMEARNLALELMKQHRLEFWHFEFDNAKCGFGIYRYNRRTIGLSRNLAILNNKEQVKDTILHEIAHALVGPNNGHNWVWKQKTNEIGCDGNRCYDSNKVNPVIGKLVAKCPNCSHIYYKHRTPVGERACGKRRHPFKERLLDFEKKIE